MTGRELSAALGALGWSSGQLAGLLGCASSLVRQWTRGEGEVPPVVAEWLQRAVWGLRAAGAPPRGWRVHPGYSVSGGELVVEGKDDDAADRVAEMESAEQSDVVGPGC